MNFHVRGMQECDIDAVYSIECTAHRAPWTRSILEDCVKIGYDCRVLEIESNNQKKLISYIICSYFGYFCHILNLGVMPAYQGQGYGKALLETLITSLSGTNISFIVLEVRPSNVIALTLYQRLGFQQTGTKVAYYRDKHGIEDAIVLRKDLGHSL